MKFGVLFATVVGAAVAAFATTTVNINHKYVSASSADVVCKEAVDNDDFCDCGSDENLTSACSSFVGTDSLFQCAYELPIPEKIYLSRLGDGICDCCDGSDESAASNCPNVCEEKKQQMLAEFEATNRIRNAGLARKEFLIAKSKDRIEELTGSLARYSHSIPIIREEIEALRKSLEANAPPASESDVSDGSADQEVSSFTEQEIEDTLSQFFSKKDPLRLQSVLGALVLHSGEKGVEDFVRICRSIPFDVADGVEIEETEALVLAMDMPAYYESFPVGSSAAEVDVDVSGVITRTDAAANAAVSEKINQMVVHLALPRYSGNNLFSLLAQTVARAVQLYSSEFASYAFTSIGLNAQQSKQLVRLGRSIQLQVAGSSEDDEYAARRKVVEDKIHELEAQLSNHLRAQSDSQSELNFAEQDENALFALYGHCFDTFAVSYTYKICAYKDAYQNSVSLGQYSGHEVVTTEHSEQTVRLFFKNGDICHALPSKPARSLTVDLACSNVGVDVAEGLSLDSNTLAQLTDIVEPEACSYTATLLTSIACK